jgi:3-oxoacyl-[acyl-carrier protein] reductase
MMDLGLKGKVVVVSAASQGLGHAIAEELAQEGVNLAICARREGPLEEARAKMAAHGVDVLAVSTDMTKAEDIENFVAKTMDHYGRIDVLINNAGDMQWGHSIKSADQVWEETFDINLRSVIRMCRLVVPIMREQGGGVIINNATAGGHSPFAGAIDYNAAKAAVLNMTKTMAMEHAADNIRVNAFNTAFIRTPLWDRVAEQNMVGVFGDSVDEVFQNLCKQYLLMPRMGRPDEVSGIVALMASDRASFTTGACWNIDGGYTRFMV